MFGQYVSNVVSGHINGEDDRAWMGYSPLFKKFAYAVKDKLPFAVEFARGRGERIIHVYRPQDRFTIGALSVVPYSENTGLFEVYSRFIDNKRHKYNSNRYRQQTKDMGKAIKAALKGFRPHRPIELADDYGGMFYDFQQRKTKELEDQLRKAVSKVTGSFSTHLPSPKLEQELHHLMQFGHKFLHPEVSEGLADYFKLQALYRQAKRKNPDAIFVRVYDDTSKGPQQVRQVADLVAIDGKTLEGLRFSSEAQELWDKKLDFRVRFPVTELPEWMIDRINVLSMLEEGDGTESVGFKASSEEFFVYPEVEPELTSE